MTRLPSLLAAALLGSLAACAPLAADADGEAKKTPAASSPSPSPDNPVSSDDPAPPAAADDGMIRRADMPLFGQWRLTDINGGLDPRSAQIILVVGRDMIHAQSQCIVWPWRYHLAQGRLETSYYAVPGIDPVPVCARGQTQQETDFAALMNAKPRINFASPDKVVLSTNAHSATFERVPGVLTRPFTSSGPIEKGELLGAWHVTAINGLRPSEPTVFLSRQLAIEIWSGCIPFYRKRVETGDDALTLDPWPEPISSCERTLSPSEKALDAMLQGPTRVVRDDINHYRLETPDGTLTLER